LRSMFLEWRSDTVLERIEVRTFYTGRVVGLSVFYFGGVINRGDKIVDVVPDRESLVVEAQVAVEDISEVHPDIQAEVHRTAYKQRATPTCTAGSFNFGRSPAKELTGSR
jgi:multidrug resistance efflux pump